MTRILKAAALILSFLLLNVANVQADPSRFTIVRAAHDAGCTKYDPQIRKISENGDFRKQYVYQVECDAMQGTYIIVVCVGDFDCAAR